MLTSANNLKNNLKTHLFEYMFHWFCMLVFDLFYSSQVSIICLLPYSIINVIIIMPEFSFLLFIFIMIIHVYSYMILLLWFYMYSFYPCVYWHVYYLCFCLILLLLWHLHFPTGINTGPSNLILSCIHLRGTSINLMLTSNILTYFFFSFYRYKPLFGQQLQPGGRPRFIPRCWFAEQRQQLHNQQPQLRFGPEPQPDPQQQTQPWRGPPAPASSPPAPITVRPLLSEQTRPLGGGRRGPGGVWLQHGLQLQPQSWHLCGPWFA